VLVITLQHRCTDIVSKARQLTLDVLAI